MRILHVVTLVSDDDAFGGPTVVAFNQAAALIDRGHDVTVAGGWKGHDSPPKRSRGVPTKLFPVLQILPTGFSGLTSPHLYRWLWRHVRGYDIVHVHAARDLITLPALGISRLRGVPYVTQTHGMIRPDERVAAKVLDFLFTRPLLRAASFRFVLTRQEGSEMGRILPNSQVSHLRNGVPATSLKARMSEHPDILFSARLHARKQPLRFVEMAALLKMRGLPMTFSIVGPDGGELSAVNSRIKELRLETLIRYEGSLPHEENLARMRRSQVYVLPSIHEPFPMSLLEAMSIGLPSICTDTCGLADSLRVSKAGLVVDGTPQSLANAVEGLLARSTWVLASRAGPEIIDRDFSMERTAGALESAYEQAIQAATA